ncbi:efflux transporter outer membrane subunit [Chitinophaga pinensis]|uniref:RND efflux system, outer membrane lipoprotein, NodT family n=1 Tax=Chitinophaga pinensis (strain ATCC 43595 / DSM 2588 / LMG 13176 / NBRC 15968 / NCIMB 11800 / UQM 2034) TaxID=485918 RepID=A0A979GVM7_CHIPD|nr:efflux transporter outer membrane subunit [Chitinophaga pinensis]ACU63513.1 RND efflux system, outer membrane lipoprotein, NodT family [Chitinophaga pinensis DSM 2588]
MNKYLYIIGFAGIAVIASCKVGKEFARPSVDMPAQFRGEASADTNNIAVLPVSSFIKDAALLRLIDSAVAKNFDVQVALKNIESAGASLKSARSGRLPDLNLSVQGTRNWPSKNSLNGSLSEQFIGTRYMDDYNAGLNLSWEVVAWGKISRLKEAALATYLQSTEASKAVRTRVISDVAQAYYNLLMLDTQKEVAYRNMQLTDSTLRIVRLQYSSGMATNLAVEQIEAQLRVSLALIPQIEQQIAIQENALKTLTGEMPGGIVRNRLQDLTADTTLAAGVPASLLSRRPDVRAAEMAVKVANARAGVAEAAMYPALNITAGVGVNSFKIDNWLNIPGSLFETVGGSITQPVFRRRQLRTEWETAKIDWEKSVIEFRRSVTTAVQEVSDALAKMDKLKEQYIFTQQRVDRLEIATHDASLLFQNGMANYLEVITAQSNALQSELDLAAVKRDQLNATVDLYRALGGGWK